MQQRMFLKILAGFLGLLAVGKLLPHLTRSSTVWQLDPDKCIQCGRCQTHCVMPESAVKCVHEYAVCGYCDFCSGYYHDNRVRFDTAAENQRCPTGAIGRTFVEDPYYQYTIDEKLCIGCGKCVKGCGDFGNGSLILQVKHDRCKNCNLCAIAIACPAQAYRRVSVDHPYLLRGGKS